MKTWRWILCALVMLSLSLPSFAHTLLEQVLISGGNGAPYGVPNYDQDDFAGNNDCGPTAAAMLLGYYAANGWPTLIPDGSPYYSGTVPPSEGLVKLDSVLKEELPYTGWLGTGDFAYLGAVSNIWHDVVDAAARMDPGAGAWTGDDDQWVSQESIKNEVRAGRPMMFCIKGTNADMLWYAPGTPEHGTTFEVDWHWLTVIGFLEYDDEFYTGMRSGWRSGGNSFLWCYWSQWDDYYTVKLGVTGAPQHSIGPHLLLTEPGGWAALGTTDGYFTASRWKYFAPRAGLTARSYERSSQYTARMLYSNKSGKAEIWAVDQSDGIGDYPMQTFNYGTGWEAVHYHRSANTSGWLLWSVHPWGSTLSGPSGRAILQRLDGFESPVGYQYYENLGYEPLSYQELPNQQGRLAWRDPAGKVVVWYLTSVGTLYTTQTFQIPMSNMSPVCARDMSDGTHRVVWTRPSTGHSLLMRYTKNFANFGLELYGPWVGWTARSYSEK